MLCLFPMFSCFSDLCSLVICHLNDAHFHLFTASACDSSDGMERDLFSRGNRQKFFCENLLHTWGLCVTTPIYGHCFLPRGWSRDSVLNSNKCTGPGNVFQNWATPWKMTVKGRIIVSFTMAIKSNDGSGIYIRYWEFFKALMPKHTF